LCHLHPAGASPAAATLQLLQKTAASLLLLLVTGLGKVRLLRVVMGLVQG
jgi:hypothetical protein